MVGGKDFNASPLDPQGVTLSAVLINVPFGIGQMVQPIQVLTTQG